MGNVQNSYYNSPTYVPPAFDQGLGRAKKGLDFNRENYVLGTLGVTTLFDVTSVAANQANTAVQAYFVLPGRVKISKIAVFCSAISAVDGTLSFNIVLGTAAYSQGSVPGNDNSSVPPVAYNAQGQATGNSGATYPAGGGGLCSNPAVAGNAMFAADVAFTVANFPNLTTGTGTGATFAQILVPSSPDAVWPNSGVLTLRTVSPASTGSISNLLIVAYTEPQTLSATFPSTQQPPAGIPEPSIDF